MNIFPFHKKKSFCVSIKMFIMLKLRNVLRKATNSSSSFILSWVFMTLENFLLFPFNQKIILLSSFFRSMSLSVIVAADKPWSNGRNACYWRIIRIKGQMEFTWKKLKAFLILLKNFFDLNLTQNTPKIHFHNLVLFE